MVPDKRYELITWVRPDGVEFLGRKPEDCKEHDEANRLNGSKPKSEIEAEDSQDDEVKFSPEGVPLDADGKEIPILDEAGQPLKPGSAKFKKAVKEVVKSLQK